MFFLVPVLLYSYDRQTMKKGGLVEPLEKLSNEILLFHYICRVEIYEENFLLIWAHKLYLGIRL